MSKLRNDYDDVMPKTQSKSEKEYNKALDDARSQANKAAEMADKVAAVGGKRDNPRWGAAYDAVRRHERRHPKTESALMLIAGYESEFAY